MPKFIFNHSFYTLEAIIILPTTTLPIPVPSSIPPIPYPERVWKEAGKRVRFVNTWPDLGARNSILKSCTSQTSDGGHSFLYLAPCLWSFICYQTWVRPWVIRGQSSFFLILQLEMQVGFTKRLDETVNLFHVSFLLLYPARAFDKPPAVW